MAETKGRTAWVCAACFETQAGRDAGTPGEPFDMPPLGLVEEGATVVPGILDSEHECEDRWVGHRPVIGCGEEEREYDDARCEGCGSPEPGGRYAMTFWSLSE